jgi:DNA-binding NarL/FixJ family response regulator
MKTKTNGEPLASPAPAEGALARKVRILIVDDHPIVCQGIRRLLEQEPDLDPCWEADDSQSALAALEVNRPDLVLLDIKLKDSDGLAFLRKIRARFPETRILIHSMYDQRLYAEAALQAGARGYLMKQDAAGAVVKAIRSVMRGEIYVSDTR